MEFMQLASISKQVRGTKVHEHLEDEMYLRKEDLLGSHEEDSHRAKKPWLAIASQLALTGAAPAEGVGEDDRETGSTASLRAAGGFATAGRALGLLTTTSGDGDTLRSWRADPTLSPLNLLGLSRSLCCTKQQSVRVQLTKRMKRYIRYFDAQPRACFDRSGKSLLRQCEEGSGWMHTSEDEKWDLLKECINTNHQNNSLLLRRAT